MWKPGYGDPVFAIRLPRQMIAATKLCARLHNTSASELVRRLIAEQLDTDGINWQTVEPTPGQTSIDDYQDA